MVVDRKRSNRKRPSKANRPILILLKLPREEEFRKSVRFIFGAGVSCTRLVDLTPMILDGPACQSMAQQMLHASAEQLLQLLRDDHLDYFVCEDEILRNEKLEPLQDLIKQYLCQAKHASKFSLPIFADILQNNVEGRPDFDACETSQAFRALEKYASNLITHPWRQEFRTIKLYSGFYKHHVARHLKGSDQILHLLGYKQLEPSVLSMEEPLDPDTLIVVSRNCLIAACECEVLYEIVKRVDHHCSYKELFKLRKSFSCDVDTLIEFFQESVCKSQKKNDESKSVMSSRSKGETVRVAQLVDLDSSPEKPKGNLLPGELYENGYSSALHPGKIGGDLSKNRPMNDTGSTKATEQCATLDDHILASVSALQAQGKQQDQSTRAETWGYVDKTLEKKGLHRGYGNRYDVLEELDRTKPKASPLPDSESSASCRKTKAPPQKPPEQHIRPPPIADGNPVGYQDPDLIQFEHFSNYLPAHGPPVPGSGPYTRYFRPAVDYSSYGYRQVGMYPNPYDFRPPPPPIYSNPPSLPPAMPLSSMEMMDTSSALRNHPAAQPPYMPVNPQTDNRRSFYDNVPVEERPLDPTSIVTQGYPSIMNYSHVYARGADPVLMYPVPDYARLPPYTYGVMPTAHVPVDQRLPPSQRGTVSTEGMLIDIGESSHAEPPASSAPKGKSDAQTNIPRAATPPLVKESSPSPPSRTHTPSQNGSSKGSLVCNNSEEAAWQCPSCTFLNGAAINICEMCGRSKTKGAESKPLESGGRQCPKCTLVNERDALDCAACETSLKDSPTYI